MTRVIRFFFLIGIIFIGTGFNTTVSAESEEGAEEIFDVTTKLGDSNYLDFEPIGKIQLPRILISEGSVYFFGSTYSAIASDLFTDAYYIENPDAAESGPVTYRLARTDGGGITLDLSITKHFVWFLLSGFLVLFIFGRLANKYKSGIGRTSAPKGAGMNFAEVLIVYLRDEVAKPNLGEKHYLKFSPYLLTCFFMILFMNLFGLLPWGITPTADVAVTGALAITTFFMVNLNGNKDYWKHIFAMPGVPPLMLIIMIPVEILGLFTKPFALAIRLFANMLSGKMIIFSMIGMIFIFATKFGTGVGLGTSPLWLVFTIFIYALKVFAAFLQAYIFTMFSALFIGMAVEEHHHHEDEEFVAETKPLTT